MIKPIFCIGETLDEMQANKTRDILESQIRTGIADLHFNSGKDLLIAYEPVWAIGTGVSADIDTIYENIKIIKDFIKKFDNNLNSSSKVAEITREEIIEKYNNKFKVIPKNAAKYFGKKILELNNLNIENLDHNKLEFLKLKGLLNKDLIRPLYLSYSLFENMCFSYNISY